MTDQHLTEHYLLVLVVQCTLLSSGLSSFVTIYIHEITTILRWGRTIFFFRDFRLSKRYSGVLCFFLILRGLLGLQNDPTMQFRIAGQRTLGDGTQYPGKPNISNHRRNLGGFIGGQMPLQYFLYLRIDFFFGYWVDERQIQKWHESGGKGWVYCILRSGSNQSSTTF